MSALETARIAALLEPFLEQPLQESQLNQISIYIDLLLRWNARINLTAIRNEEEIVTRHFGESFFMARHLFPADRLFPTTSNPCHPERSQARSEAPGLAESKDPYTLSHSAPPASPRVIDIGSGAGFPALPLKIWSPNLHLTLIESNHKKSAFLREVARALTLTNLNVITDRVETVSGLPPADVVTLRAVERFETILPQTAALLAPTGRLAVLIGSAQLPLLTTLTNLEWQPPITVPESQSRVLSIGIH